MYIRAELLERELKMAEGALGKPIGSRLIIDYQAGVHTEKHTKGESGMHERMGSTAHGCGEASIDKMRRGFEYSSFCNTPEGQELKHKYGFQFGDVSEVLNKLYDQGKTLLLEGTQGAALDLFHGYYPYVTSRSTIAANWFAEAGLSPSLENQVIMVCRTMPIRVAGNSGPMFGEIEWVDLAKDINEKRKKAGMVPLVDPVLVANFEMACRDLAATHGLSTWRLSELPEGERKLKRTQVVNFHKQVFERLGAEPTAELRKLLELTTVTVKLRRIAHPDWVQLRKAVQLNRPSKIALTFLNYILPEVIDCNTWEDIKKSGHVRKVKAIIKKWESELGVKVGFISANKNSVISL